MRPAGLQHEMWALLALYPALGIVITDAVETAQTLVTGARGVITGANELAEDIGHRLGKPARATPTTCLRPQGQIRATALEQALARQTVHLPADHQDHHRDPPGTTADSDTPSTVPDNRHWTINAPALGLDWPRVARPEHGRAESGDGGVARRGVCRGQWPRRRIQVAAGIMAKGH